MKTGRLPGQVPRPQKHCNQGQGRDCHDLHVARDRHWLCRVRTTRTLSAIAPTPRRESVISSASSRGNPRPETAADTRWSAVGGGLTAGPRGAAPLGESTVPNGSREAADAVAGKPGGNLAGAPRSLSEWASDSPAGCFSWLSRPGSRWRSSKARASQYMAVLDRAPRDCGDSISQIAASPSCVFRSILAGPARASFSDATAAEENPAVASSERSDSSTTVTFRCRTGNAPSPVALLFPATLSILRCWEVTGFWLTNSARIRR